MQRSKDKTYDVPLDYIPEYTAGLKIAASRPWRRIRINGEFGVNHVAQRKFLDFANAGINETPNGRRLYVPLDSLDPHTSVDLACRAVFSPRFTLSITIQNLFNAKWQEAAGTLMPRRFATIKLMTSF
jgi:hypothetical protein